MKRTWRYVLGVTLLDGVLMFGAQAAQPTRQRIVSNEYVHADGCHGASKDEKVNIPYAQRLDRSYAGALPGIELVSKGNGSHGVRNLHFLNNGSSMAFTLWAHGAGHWIPPVCAFGKCVGGGWCAGAAGAWIHLDVYAHYNAKLSKSH